MRCFIGNAFSLSMIEGDAKLKVLEINAKIASRILDFGFTSVVGHESTAEVFARLLDQPIKMNRVTVHLSEGDLIIIGQLKERLPEGKTLSNEELLNLPIVWKVVFVGREEFFNTCARTGIDCEVTREYLQDCAMSGPEWCPFRINS